jgi:hypothetical protein
MARSLAIVDPNPCAIERGSCDGPLEPSGNINSHMDKPPADTPDTVPVFGTWSRIYWAVVAVNAVWIAFSYFFTRFPY